MAPRTPPLIGKANVHRLPNGKLVIDSASLRRSNADDDLGDDDDDFGDDDDDLGDDDDDLGDDDDDLGDVDDLGDLGDDDDDLGDVDDLGARPMSPAARKKALARKRAAKKRKNTAAKRKVLAKKKKIMAFKYPTTVSQVGVSAAVIAAGAAGIVLMQLTPSVTVKLNDLRISFDPPAPLVAGSNLQFRVTQVRVGDDLIWNDAVGVDSRQFLGDTTLRHMLVGRYASPAQPIFVQGQFVNNGSVATATTATASATVTAFKKIR